MPGSWYSTRYMLFWANLAFAVVHVFTAFYILERAKD